MNLSHKPDPPTHNEVDYRADLRQPRVAPLGQRPPVWIDQRPLAVVQQPVGAQRP